MTASQAAKPYLQLRRGGQGRILCVRVRDGGALGCYGWHAKCVVITSNAAYSPCEERISENGTFNALVAIRVVGARARLFSSHPLFLPTIQRQQL